MRRAQLAATIDHTLLTATATRGDIENLCRQAVGHQFYGVCIHPSYLELAKSLIAESPLKLVTVVGFPLGATTSATKAFETEECCRLGADEIDMVLPLGRFKSRDDIAVTHDIEAVVKAAQGRVVKVILETGWLDPEEIDRACDLCQRAGAHFIKTSTGFGPGGAEPWCIEQIRARIGATMKIKASGKIRSAAQALALLRAGADRLGASASVQILDEVVED